MTDPEPLHVTRREAYLMVLTECLKLMTVDELDDVGRFLKFRGYVDTYKEDVKRAIAARWHQ